MFLPAKILKIFQTSKPKYAARNRFCIFDHTFCIFVHSLQI